MTLTCKSGPGYISEMVRCRKVILGMDIGYCVQCSTSGRDLDLTFDLAVLNLTYKSCPGYISELLRCRKLIFGRDIG